MYIIGTDIYLFWMQTRCCRANRISPTDNTAKEPEMISPRTPLDSHNDESHLK
jgi:hypothetical protein